MLITYIAILIALYALITAFYELIYLLIFGQLKQKKSVLTYMKQLRGLELTSNKGKSKLQTYLGTASGKGNNLLGIAILFGICLGLFLFGVLLFKNLMYAVLFGLLGLVYPRLVILRRKEKEREKTILQFREAILSISNSLKAGSSLQIAFVRCQEDLEKQLANEKEKPMLLEIEKLNKNIQFGTPIDAALRKFSDSIKLEDVSQFVDAILIVKAKGGNLAEVIQNTTKMITDKITIQQEIKVATAQKRMEAKILTYMPVGMILAILLLNPGYMTPMYESWIGSSLLFLAALMLIANYFLGRKLTSIKI